MTDGVDVLRDLTTLVVPSTGALQETGDVFDPYQLVDGAGLVVVPVAEYLRDLQAASRSVSTQRSYGLDLLRWFRFLWALESDWVLATRVEARDFCRWMQVSVKPVRAHWRTGQLPVDRQPAGSVNSVTGKAAPGERYSPATVAHCETVVRSFYDYHVQMGTGPIVNPFPLARRGRPYQHQNPMEPFARERTGLYRPRRSERIPRHIPDGLFEELFAGLSSHRDRALVALWISTGARASELLGVRCANIDPGSQLVTVIRKGSRALQSLPAAADAFVWVRLYQQQMNDLVATGADDPLWWTLRRPFRPLRYHAARAMFARANSALGANWSLHDLRHSAAYRMARDPQMLLTDVQWVLGHTHLSTTQIYIRPTAADVIEAVVAHHRRQGEQPVPAPPPAPGYRPESLDILFGARW